MRWRKLGLLYCPDGHDPLMHSYAMMPTPFKLASGTWRILFASADADVVSRMFAVDVESFQPFKLDQRTIVPVMDIGVAGTFDDSGVNPSSIVSATPGEHSLFYVGYQRQRRVPYTLFSGLAAYDETQNKAVRVRQVPLLDRSEDALVVRTAPWVLHDERGWHLWYVAGSSFIETEFGIKPTYDIRYQQSRDGTDWAAGRDDVVIRTEPPLEIGLGRPCVVPTTDGYEMFYSRRMRAGYALGYAKSRDGRRWRREDQSAGLSVSDHGWDSEMICYTTIIDEGGERYMLYNGNGYGRTGFGVAVLEQD